MRRWRIAIEPARKTIEGPRTDAEPHLERRWAGPVITSYAQNAEDVRLWRVLASRERGFYVDVGAGDPTVGSVTKLFYDAGWSGINVEPGPDHAALAAARSRDITLDVAIASEPGEREMWISHPDRGLSSLEPIPLERLPAGFTVARKRVQTQTLDEVLEEHGQGRQLDFLKIDVEGAERTVLESIDLDVTRPTVVVVEAISPLSFRSTHDEWEHHLLEAEYEFAAFDGINRFYVPRDQADLVSALAYPVTVLDRFQTSELVEARATAAFLATERGSSVPESSELPESRLEATTRQALAQIYEMENTVSWRVTRPLRYVRRLQRGWAKHSVQDAHPEARPTVLELETAFVTRLGCIAGVLPEERRSAQAESSLPHALRSYEASVAQSALPASVVAWLSLAAVSGSYPAESDVDAATRVLRTRGPTAFVDEMLHRFRLLVDSGRSGTSGLEVIEDVVVVDATHTVSSDRHTGIQRVVRETLSRWLATRHEVRLAAWNEEQGCLMRLSNEESRRLLRWRDELNESGAPIAVRELDFATGEALVPLGCRLILPEVPQSPQARGLRGLVRAQATSGLSVIGFDAIPIVSAETMSRGMAETFCDYLSLVKQADRLSAISEGAAESFRAFGAMLAVEGTTGPDVRAQPLPTEVSPLGARKLEIARSSLQLTGEPLVLVVGSQEPRKNHLAVLEAAERLWADGLRFELVMLGGTRSSDNEFSRYVERLRRVGRPLNVRRRVTDTEIWAAYQLARFSVFPSLVEGFGLPVAESIAAGTPVITSSYGSMAEIGAVGGALLVDPRDIDEITSQMRRLLTDDELVARLRREARGRDLGTWDDYARNVWEYLTAS